MDVTSTIYDCYKFLISDVFESIWVEVFPQVESHFRRSIDMLAISHPTYLIDILAEFSLISLDQ